jgi:hypothetical protein
MVAHPLMSPVPTCELHHPEQRRVEQFQRVDHAEHQ